jgi:hypothetical protein
MIEKEVFFKVQIDVVNDKIYEMWETECLEFIKLLESPFDILEATMQSNSQKFKMTIRREELIAFGINAKVIEIFEIHEFDCYELRWYFCATSNLSFIIGLGYGYKCDFIRNLCF